MTAPAIGAYGWPLVPSVRWPGETALGCPACGSTRVTLTGAYGARGTGPGGRGRLGDPGARSWARCDECGARSDTRASVVASLRALGFTVAAGWLEDGDPVADVLAWFDDARDDGTGTAPPADWDRARAWIASVVD